MSEDYSAIYDPDTDFDAKWTAVCALAIVQRIPPGSTVLELGCASGLMTSVLWSAGMKVTAVDRSEAWLERARARNLTGVEWVHGDVMDLADRGLHEHVIAGNLLGEVESPADLLRQMAVYAERWHGRIHLTTGNARSLHRVYGEALGWADRQSPRGDLYGVKRVYDVADLAAEAIRVRLRPLHVATLGVKPYPNEVMARLPEDVRGELLRAVPPPGLGAMIYMEAAV